MTLRWRRQPPDLSCCGQVAVAVAADITLAEAIAVVGHTNCTRTRDLVRALRRYDFVCPDRCRPLREPPDFALAQVRKPGWPGWHWIVVHDGVIYDGSFGTPDGVVRWPDGMRITSYLPLTR